jgi:hypothetical protein
MFDSCHRRRTGLMDDDRVRELTEQWIEGVIAKLEAVRIYITPAHRARLKKLLARKTEATKAAHRPLKWTDTELRVLRRMFIDHRDIGGVTYAQNVAALARVWHVQESTMRKALNRASKAERARNSK